jgi:hypothetical protein
LINKNDIFVKESKVYIVVFQKEIETLEGELKTVQKEMSKYPRPEDVALG